MSIKRRDLTTVIAIGIILGVLAASQAKAGIRVNARVRVPGGVIQVDHHRHGRPLPRRCLVPREITRHDRKVAGRLARYTGEKKRDILRLRRVGFRWQEIGRWLGISRRTVQAAQHGDTWRLHLRRVNRLDRQRMPAHREPNRRCDIDDRDHRW